MGKLTPTGGDLARRGKATFMVTSKDHANKIPEQQGLIRIV
jgi:hypothetical protein